MVKLEGIEALGTHWWFELFDAPADQAESFRMFLTDRLTTFDATYSRFNPDSITYHLNTTGSVERSQTPAFAEFVALLQFGIERYADTNGVFNVLTAGTQVAQGYGQADSVRLVDNGTEQLDPASNIVISDERITLKNGAVDLGGFGKGWLIDSTAKMLQTQFGLERFLINGGGDMYATSEPGGTPIEILVEHPTIAGNVVAKVPLRNQGFAASSTHKRQWQKDGATQQHIIKDHDDAVAAHVVADTTLTADVFATLACAVSPAAAPTVLSDARLEYLIMKDTAAAYSEGFEGWLL